MDVKALIQQIKNQYLADDMPWIIGFSGGKDSTTVLQLIFQAVQKIPVTLRTKPIHVISNDTLVENPVVQNFIDDQLKKIQKAGKEILYPHNTRLFVVKKTVPKIEDTFWVNLLGKGYPAPNRWFRWCTQRMKINPTQEYILNNSRLSKKCIVVLGTRKAESTDRAKSMTRFETENGGVLRKYSLENTWVFAPIANLSNDDVWTYLLQVPNFWGSNNKELLTLYRNATGECPLVIETGTASCGNSRFGCWVCTVVKKDKSMENLIESGQEWMESLLDFRNWLVELRDYETDIYIYSDYSSGPLLLKTRKKIFAKLLSMEEEMKKQLISIEEKKYIQKIFKKDEKEFLSDGLFRFKIKTKNDTTLTLITDYNVLKSKRKRIGNIHLTSASVIQEEQINPAEYDSLKELTRVLYHQTN
jgi:DNA sulfur modification protein DndC